MATVRKESWRRIEVVSTGSSEREGRARTGGEVWRRCFAKRRVGGRKGSFSESGRGHFSRRGNVSEKGRGSFSEKRGRGGFRGNFSERRRGSFSEKGRGSFSEKGRGSFSFVLRTKCLQTYPRKF